MGKHVSRRRFLRTTLAAAGGAYVLGDARLARGYQANQKLNVALIGVGGRGTWFVDTMPKMANVVALCDVNDRKLAEAFKRWADLGTKWEKSPHSWEQKAAEEYRRLGQDKPRTFRDFRRMFDQSARQIDAVVVATPDHTHATASAAAMHAGKGVFCEKPLTRTVGESRALRDLARKQKVATAMGNQGTYSGAFRRALELIRDGALGEIREAHVWNTGGGSDRTEPPKGEPPVPDYLDWDLWLGPAAQRPYHPDWMRRNNWRDFGTCQLGNWAPHSANLAFLSLQVHQLWQAKPPAASIRVRAECSGLNRLSFPRWEIVRWDVPARGELKPITITWHNGPTPSAKELIDRATQGAAENEKDLWRFAGTLIVGTKGSLHATGHNASFRLLPAEKFADVQCTRPERVENSRGPEQDWLAACRGGPPAWTNFDYAAALNEFLMLGNVATQCTGALTYDPPARKITNDAQADALLGCPCRQGWSL